MNWLQRIFVKVVWTASRVAVKDLSCLPIQTEGSSAATSGPKATEKKGNQGGGLQIPCLLSMPTRNHMDITTPPLPPVAPEVLRVAEHRHKKGLMYPYIFHVLTKVSLTLLITFTCFQFNSSLW